VGILIKQSISSTIFIYAGAVIGFVNTTILYPKFLTESQIGALNLIVTYAIILGMVGVGGFTRAITKFFPYYRNSGEKHKGFLFLIISVGILGFLLLSAIFLPVQNWLSERYVVKSHDFAQYIYLILPLTFVHIFWNLFDTYNTMLYRTIYGISLKEFWLRLIFTIGLVLLILNVIDFDGYVKVYFVGFIIVLIALIMHLIYFGDFNILPKFSEYKTTYLREMVSWSAYGLVTGLSGFAALKIDTIMINDYLGDAATGVYVTVFNFTTLILMPNRGMSRIASTIISDAFKVKDFQKVEDMYKRSCLTQAVIALLIFLGLVVNIDNIFRILPQSYQIGYWVIVIIGFANVMRMIAGVSENIIALSKYYRYQTYFILFYLLTIVITNLMLIPIYGINGAAMASAFSILIYFFIRYIFLYMKFGYQPYTFKYLGITIITILVFFALRLIPYLGNLVLDILVRSLITTCLFLVPLYYFKISSDINTLIDNTLQFFQSKFKG